MATDSDYDYRISSSEDEITRPPAHNLPSALPVRVSAPDHRKRQAEDLIAPAGPPPLKRMKGEFNAAYLNLLNQDIHDALSGLRHGDEDQEPEDTLIGAVMWSAAEKKSLCMAVGRLGKVDTGGIAARIGTKSEVEVRQYLALLDAPERCRQSGEGKGGQHPLRPVDIPAAVEIGAECAAALETAADALSLRQESYEEDVEKERWGSRWLVTALLAQILENSLHGRQQSSFETSTPQSHSREKGRDEKNRILDELPFLQLFHVLNWLQLSERIFMNSAVSDNNWRAIVEEHEPPAIRATAFADFHALVLSITRRLLLATIYVAESRTRTKSLNDARRRANPRIRVEDVRAAVSSLGMKRTSGKFWAQCARRLQLDVIDDKTGEDDFKGQADEETDSDGGEDMDDIRPNPVISSPEDAEETQQRTEQNEEDEPDVMSYDEVEAALGFPVVNNMRSEPSALEDISSASEEETDEEDQQEESPEDDGEYEEDIYMGDQEGTAYSELDDRLNLSAIKRDMEEAMISFVPDEHTGTDTVLTRRAYKSQIRAEHRQVRDAERLDLQASANAETVLWAMLRGDSDSRN
ncbi:hypothetical protein GGS24DRAFT_142751 [Hypoxylon argillaceum]|nr:hypothetical protein GGS24DRAFT_142751 [Hypoxylon argillaceum]